MKRMIQMDEKDNVATALEFIGKGEQAIIFSKKNIEINTLKALEDIPMGNKIALHQIEKGQPIVKYGVVVGESVVPIMKGSFVHVHNVKSLVADLPTATKQEIMRQMGYDSKKEGGST